MPPTAPPTAPLPTAPVLPTAPPTAHRAVTHHCGPSLTAAYAADHCATIHRAAAHHAARAAYPAAAVPEPRSDSPTVLLQANRVQRRVLAADVQPSAHDLERVARQLRLANVVIQLV
jgi:hypothetical protein